MLFILIALISLLLQLLLPWWVIVPVAFILAFWKAENAKHAFLSGFGAIYLLWALIALSKTLPNHHLLANRIGQIFMLPPLPFNWVIVLIVSGLIGSLVAGFSAQAGYYWKEFNVAKKIKH